MGGRRNRNCDKGDLNRRNVKRQWPGQKNDRRVDEYAGSRHQSNAGFSSSENNSHVRSSTSGSRSNPNLSKATSTSSCLEVLSKIEDVITPKIAIDLERNFCDMSSAFPGPVCHIRTGGHIGFIRGTIYGAGPTIILGTSAITQALIQDKVERTQQGYTVFGRNFHEKHSILHLPLMAHDIIRTVGRIKWRDQHLQFLPFTKDQIRMSCILLVKNEAPTQEDLIAMNANRFSSHCSVFLGRYLICYNDPVVIAYYILSQQQRATMKISDSTRDGIVRLRLKQMLLGNNCSVSKIELKWEDIPAHLSPAACNMTSSNHHLYNLFCHLQIPMQDVVPEVWTIPENPVRSHDNVMQIIDCMQSEASEIPTTSSLKGVLYSDHWEELDYTTLLYRLGSDILHDDLFASLANSSLVNYDKCLQEYYDARYGPADAKRNELHLGICALTDVFYRPHVEPFASDYIVGTSNRAQVMRNYYFHLINLIQKLENYST